MAEYKIEDLGNIQNFLLGGKADFILNDKNTLTHINFLIKKVGDNKDLYYAYYKSIDWTYIGFIKTKIRVIENVEYNIPFYYPLLPEKYPTKDQTEKGEILRKLIVFIYYIQKIPLNVEVLFTGKCSVCGRKLTNPKYIAIGIGQYCLDNN